MAPKATMEHRNNKCGPGSSASAKNVAVEVRNATGKMKCEFCNRPRLNGNEVEQAGKLYKYFGKYFHFFCVLFSHGIVQATNEAVGLKGFDSPSIQRALRNGNSSVCVFCKLPGASIRCKMAKCKTSYHFPCGYNANVLFVFHQDMRSMCSKHKPKQKQKVKVKEKICIAGCLEEIRTHDKVIVSRCCGRKYHLNCVQQIALNSGLHHFKCPACAAKKKFVDGAMACGIYVPVQDASWETDEEFYAFQSQGALYKRCDAENCICPQGREHTLNGTLFELIRCENCGCSAVHIKCGGLLKKAPFYLCDRHNGSVEEMARHKVEIKKNPDYSSESESEVAAVEPVRKNREVQPNATRRLTARKSTGGRAACLKELASLDSSSSGSDDEVGFNMVRQAIDKRKCEDVRVVSQTAQLKNSFDLTRKKQRIDGRKPFGLLSHRQPVTKTPLKFSTSQQTLWKEPRYPDPNSMLKVQEFAAATGRDGNLATPVTRSSWATPYTLPQVPAFFPLDDPTEQKSVLYVLPELCASTSTLAPPHSYLAQEGRVEALSMASSIGGNPSNPCQLTSDIDGDGGLPVIGQTFSISDQESVRDILQLGREISSENPNDDIDVIWLN